MATLNAAKSVGLNNIGEINLGKRADLILFTIENDRIKIQKTLLAGVEVYSNN
jgi:N-acetylglucosamine-6-phosphate deacetylase